MRREGSALHGFGVVTLKEIADHFTSILVVVLVVLVVATATAVVRGAIDQIKEITAEDPYLFLRLFTRGGPLPLVALLSFLVPLVALGLWLFLTILWPLFSPALSDAVTTAGDVLGVLDTRQAFARLSPSVLFNEIVAVVLDPSVRSTQQSMLAALGLALIERGAIPDAPIPLVQSVLIVWPQIVGLAAGAILLFVVAYIVFQRQEVRA